MKVFNTRQDITPEWLEEAYKDGLLRKDQLEDGCYYLGHCRNASVAKWDAKADKFFYVRTKFSARFCEDINYVADDNGYDLFTPTEKVEPTEHQKVWEDNND
jgi:hypothetical protein